MTLSGLFGLLLTPMDIFTKSTLHGDFTPINVALLVLGLMSAVAMWWRVWSYARQEGVVLDSTAGESRITQAILEEDEE